MKFLVIAPFWKDPKHVGVYRIDRFLRWLAKRNIPVVLVRRGDDNRAESTLWGTEIAIRHPLQRVRTDVRAVRVETGRPRYGTLLFNWLQDRILCPDPQILWAWWAARHPLVLRFAEGATHVLASNPPESAHVAAYRLARKRRANLVVDMRDGWLDEPLKPLLQRSPLRRWREGVQEKRILKLATIIFVTSDVWRDLLETRLPFTRGKIKVLTNAYPSNEIAITEHTGAATAAKTRHLRLFHIGRFTGSSNSRRPRHLLEPLLRGIKATDAPGEIIMLGDLRPDDIAEIKIYDRQFESFGWNLIVKPHVPQDEALENLRAADGLLLLSTSCAAIPSKLFEYISSTKPILALTPSQSAVWRLGERVPQLYLVDYTRADQQWGSTAADFLESCRCGQRGEVPPEFSEEHTSQVFCKAVLSE